MTEKKNTKVAHKIFWSGPNVLVRCPQYTRVCLVGIFWATHPHCVKATELKQENTVLLHPTFIAPNQVFDYVQKACKTCKANVKTNKKQR